MITIIDYEAGNLTSVASAIASIGESFEITREPARIKNAERVIFPGVGAAGSAMESLKKFGLDEAIHDFLASGKPLMGICLGTQIITEYSEENDTSCLGLSRGRVSRFPSDMPAENGGVLKVPQMGWNRINIKKEHPVLAGIKPDDEFYFVHGYYPQAADPAHVLAETEYGIIFSSVMGFGNLVATQFHPEKSGRPGLGILKNFCGWKPC